MADIAIKVEKVYKDFRLPHEKNSTIKSHFTNILKGKGGRKNIEIQHALKGISFEVQKGEFFGIVGRNGSGKSTLLKILAGIYQPTKGSVQTTGRIVPFIELGVGFNAELSGRENVYLNGAVLGFSRKEIDSKYASIVEFAELEKFMDQKLKNYSSGMQVRLAFSVATILADSDILLIDEVLAVGDSSFQRKCFEYFSKLKKIKKTVVFVTHDMSAVIEYCDRVALIDNNELKEIGKPSKISSLYLKMFENEANEEAQVGKGEIKSWGDKVVVLEDQTIENKNNEITVSATIKAKQDAEVIVGIMLKSPQGQPIFGTNTKLITEKNLYIKKDNTVICSWNFMNVLNTGKYTVDIAINHSNGIGVHHWKQDVLNISINRSKKTPFIIDLPVNMSIKDGPK